MHYTSPIRTRYLQRIPIVLFLISVFLLAFSRIWDTDVWMHLSLGRLIWEQRGFPAGDPFVYTNDAIPFLRSYSSWLFGVLSFSAYQASGLFGLVLLKALAAVATCLVLLRDALRPYRNHVVSLVVMSVMVIAMRYRFVERPDSIAMLFLAYSIFSLNAFVHDGRKYLYALPAAHLVWANMHSSIVLMVVPFLSFLAGGLLQQWFSDRGHRFPASPSREQMRTIALVFAASFAASLVSPYFLGQYTFGSGFLASPFFKQVIQELQAASWEYTKWPFLLAVAVILSFVLNWRRFSLIDVLLVLPFLVLPFTARRFLFLLAVVGGPIIARNLSAVTGQFAKRSVLAGTAAHGAAAVWIVAAAALTLSNTFRVADIKVPFGTGIDAGAVPQGALAFMEQQGINGRVFNVLHWGGYILWRDYPQMTVFVDPRCAIPHPLLESLDRARQSTTLLDELSAKYGFASALVDYPAVSEKEVLTDERFGRALAHPAWALVYWDDRSLVYLKRGGRYDGIIGRFEYRFIAPEPNVARAGMRDAKRRELAVQELLRNIRETGSARAYKLLGDYYQETGSYREALDAYRKALEQPLVDRFAAYSGIASSLRGLGSPDEALPYLRKALALRQDPALVSNLGLYLLAKGERKEALAQLEKALRLNPELISLYPLIIDLSAELGMADKASRMKERQASASRASAGEEHFRSGLQAYIRKQYDTALQEFASSIAVNPGNPAPYSNMGYVYFDTGRMDMAFEYQRKALDRDPNLANAHFGLALIYTRSGDLRAAKRHWEEYLRIEPAGYYSRKVREELRAIP